AERRLAHHPLQKRLEPVPSRGRLQTKHGRKQIEHAAAGRSRDTEIAADHRRDRPSSTAVTNDADVCGRPTDVEQGERLRRAIRAEDMGVAVRDENEVATSHAELLPALEGESG